MKEFLVCNKCGTEKIKFTGLKRENNFMHVRLECSHCKEKEVITINHDDFVVWVKTPEISAAYNVFKKPKSQESLW